MTHRRDKNGSRAYLTPDAASELLTIFTRAENPITGNLPKFLSAATLLEG